MDDGQSNHLPGGTGFSVSDAGLEALESNVVYRPGYHYFCLFPGPGHETAGFCSALWFGADAHGRSDLTGCTAFSPAGRSEEHTSELQSRFDLVCRLLLE